MLVADTSGSCIKSADVWLADLKVNYNTKGNFMDILRQIINNLALIFAFWRGDVKPPVDYEE